MNKISKTQFEFYKQKHYELWDWLSKNLDSTKFEWFISVCPEELNMTNDCFACEITKTLSGDEEDNSQASCEYCPITDFESCDCCDGLYHLYTGAQNEEKRSRFAEQIRDLPWDKNDILCYVEVENDEL